MSKQQAVKSLESIIARLSSLNYKIEGNELHDAIGQVAYVRDKVRSGEMELRKIKRRK